MCASGKRAHPYLGLILLLKWKNVSTVYQRIGLIECVVPWISWLWFVWGALKLGDVMDGLAGWVRKLRNQSCGCWAGCQDCC